MIKAIMKRFEMRLTQEHVERLTIITDIKGLPSRADAVRYLIDKEFKEVLEDVKDAGE